MNNIVLIAATIIGVLGFVLWVGGAEKPWPSALFAVSSILSGVYSYLEFRKIKKMRSQDIRKLVVCLSVDKGGPCIIHPDGMPGCINTMNRVLQ